MQHIMVATDGSEGGDRAVDVGAELAKTCGGDLSIVTVGGNVSGDEMQQLARAEGNIGDALEALSEQILAAAKTRAQRLGVAQVQLRTGWGDPAQSIIDIAASDNTDAIVLGRRGRGRLAGLLLGSVSQKVVSLAPCTVIVVP
jgi:nucleotide-binding universal stress UspA family protein